MIRFALFMLITLTTTQAPARELVQGPVEADVVRVRDGDSIDVIAHVWPGHNVRVSIRIRGIDAPELRARCLREKEQAVAARTYLSDMVENGRIRLYDISGGKYFGRVLARVTTTSGIDVKSAMLKAQLVRPYRGRKRASWCTEVSELN